jgi:hypothetical protein
VQLGDPAQADYRLYLGVPRRADSGDHDAKILAYSEALASVELASVLLLWVMLYGPLREASTGRSRHNRFTAAHTRSANRPLLCR